MDDFAQELEKDFLEEAFSLIDNFESSLLELEKDQSDHKAINEIFRVAHTIKGGAGTVGFNEIQEFTHLIEDVLDLVRKDTLTLSKDDISTLLECRDELEKMLTHREKGNVHESDTVAGLVDQLKALKNTGADPDQEKKSAQKQELDIPKLVFTGYELSLISEFLSSNKKVYQCYYELNESYEMREVSAFQLYSLINDLGEILKMYPTMEVFETQFYPIVTFIITSESRADFIKEKTFLTDMISVVNITPVDSQVLNQLEKDYGEHPQKASEFTDKKSSSETLPVDNKKTEPKKTQSDPKKPEIIEKRALSTLRVESWKVDNLLNLLGELVITKATFAQLDYNFEQLSSNVRGLLKEFLGGVAELHLSDDEESNKEKNHVLVDSLNQLFISFENYSESMQKLNRISSSLQENVMNMRMLPIQMVFSRFPRLIRDISNKLNKKIDLVIEGVETEIDKGMVDDIFDPLIHLLRNAIDHGIESPEDRKAAGKPETGKIILKATHEGDSIVIEVADDGKGIDPEVIRKKAIETHVLPQGNIEKMAPREVLSLIFLPGFSTADKVSNLSGRGVGMDVVKRKIEEIGGNVGIATAKGKGTRFIIRLPLTLAIIQGLLIVVEKMYYVIPVASVEETVIIDSSELKEISGHYTYEFRNKLIPILSLKGFFYKKKLEEGTKEYCIVTRYGDRVVGIVVSEVIGEQDIVIKPLNTKLIKTPGISAATIVGNGDIGYIIDTSQIISHYFKSTR